jgi:hypothetical protein
MHVMSVRRSYCSFLSKNSMEVEGGKFCSESEGGSGMKGKTMRKCECNSP